MTETFKASNGWYIDEDVMHDHVGHDRYTDEVAQMRQFFLEERDHELGRWRSKKDPSWTAVRDAEIVYFQNEDGKRSFLIEADGTTSQWWSDDLLAVAREYFDAHPAHKPLPTTQGLYGHKGTFETDGYSSVLELAASGRWVRANGDVDERVTAQAWHDAGQLVRLTPEYEGENK